MYGLPTVLVAFLVAYAIWFRRVVLDIPVGLRLFLSAIPGIVGYRTARTLYCLLVYRTYRGRAYLPGTRMPARSFVVLLIAATGVAGVVLYHIWRDVNWDDFLRGR